MLRPHSATISSVWHPAWQYTSAWLSSPSVTLTLGFLSPKPLPCPGSGQETIQPEPTRRTPSALSRINSTGFTSQNSQVFGALLHEPLKRGPLNSNRPAHAGRSDLPGVNELPERGPGQTRVSFALLVVEPRGSNGYLIVVFGHDAPPF